MSEPLLQVRHLSKRFPHVQALTGVSFTMQQGEVLGLVGESGSGKSTLGRTILRLLPPDDGSIVFDGTDITKLGNRALRPLRRRMQMVFQDPFSSLDPRMTAGQTISEALIVHRMVSRAEGGAWVASLLNSVGLAPEHATRYPHEFSGGQRQRLGIARALAVEPKFLVADEPVSALDVSVQAQIVNLLYDLQQKLGLTLLFISHDLAVVEQLCHRAIVLYLGRIMETGTVAELFSSPKHPYTEALLSASPIPIPGAKRERILLKGDISSSGGAPSGCVFRARCPYSIPDCSQIVPELREVSPGHWKACIRDVL